jgi:pyruvate/2-oxoglutarate dehydrogenase complex dihydrolipoamide acyltransferase (E2) component
VTTTRVNLPKLSAAMVEGTLAEWLVEDGARIILRQPLYVIETDKVETEIEAPCAGVVRLIATAGEVYPIGSCVAEILDPDEVDATTPGLE